MPRIQKSMKSKKRESSPPAYSKTRDNKHIPKTKRHVVIFVSICLTLFLVQGYFGVKTLDQCPIAKGVPIAVTTCAGLGAIIIALVALEFQLFKKHGFLNLVTLITLYLLVCLFYIILIFGVLDIMSTAGENFDETMCSKLCTRTALITAFGNFFFPFTFVGVLFY